VIGNEKITDMISCPKIKKSIESLNFLNFGEMVMRCRGIPPFSPSTNSPEKQINEEPQEED